MIWPINIFYSFIVLMTLILSVNCHKNSNDWQRTSRELTNPPPSPSDIDAPIDLDRVRQDSDIEMYLTQVINNSNYIKHRSCENLNKINQWLDSSSPHSKNDSTQMQSLEMNRFKIKVNRLDCKNQIIKNKSGRLEPQVSLSSFMFFPNFTTKFGFDKIFIQNKSTCSSLILTREQIKKTQEFTKKFISNENGTELVDSHGLSYDLFDREPMASGLTGNFQVILNLIDKKNDPLNNKEWYSYLSVIQGLNKIQFFYLKSLPSCSDKYEVCNNDKVTHSENSELTISENLKKLDFIKEERLCKEKKQ